MIDFSIGLMLTFPKKDRLDYWINHSCEHARHQADAKAIKVVFVANKKRYSCWFFLVLWVAKMACTIGESTTDLSHFRYLQKQCKYYRCNHNAYKTVLKLLRYTGLNFKENVVRDYGSGLWRTVFLSSFLPMFQW